MMNITSLVEALGVALLFTILCSCEAGGKEGAPIVTINAGG